MPSILIVDDEANIRGSLKGALTRAGYTVDDALLLLAKDDAVFMHCLPAG